MDFSLLSKYRISFPASRTVSSVQSALESAKKIGYPVAMKVISSQVLHKSDRGGVMLNINSAGEAEKAYHLLIERYRGVRIDGILVQKMAGRGGVELIIGGKRDPQFGQLIMLGMGGVFVEIMKDVSLRVCPITEEDALEMVHELRSYPMLAGARGTKPVNQKELVSILVKVSSLLLNEDPKEFDINPLIADADGCIAVDMRILK